MIPDHKDTLRIAGRGRIAADESLRSRFEVNGRIPDLVLVIDVEQVFMHCAKSIMRSRLWKPDTWSAAGAPSLAAWVKSVIATDQTVADLQARHEADEESRLY